MEQKKQKPKNATNQPPPKKAKKEIETQLMAETMMHEYHDPYLYYLPNNTTQPGFGNGSYTPAQITPRFDY